MISLAFLSFCAIIVKMIVSSKEDANVRRQDVSPIKNYSTKEG